MPSWKPAGLSRAVLAWPIVLLVALAVPTPGGGVFDGLPFSRWVEFLTFLVIVPSVVSLRLRRVFRRAAGRLHPFAPIVATGLAAVAGLLNVAIAVTGSPAGFRACYQSAIPEQPSARCERSYENLFDRDGMTRVDATITFSADDWKLAFFNDLRFNYYSWVPGEYERSRLPFSATWRGEVALETRRTIVVEYSGEGRLEVGDGSVQLPAAYDGVNRVTLAAPAGRQRMGLDYRFADGSRVGALRKGPGPTLRVTTVGQDGTVVIPLTASSPPWLHRTARRVADGILVTLTVAAGLLTVAVLARDWVALGAAAAAAFMVAHVTQAGTEFRLLSLAHVGVAWWLLAGGRRRTRRLLFSYGATAALVCGTLVGLRMATNVMWLRDGGSDWLTYESLARAILDTGSLQAGENVFYYQPLSRYLRFGLHALFGDGDAFVAAAELMALNLSVLWLCWLVAFRPGRGTVDRLLVGCAAALLFSLVNTPRLIIQLIAQGASETWTWILLPLALGLLFHPSPGRYRLGGVVALALSLITRFNQAPAILLMMALALWAHRRQPVGRLATWVVVFAGIALLPLAHNLYYGGEVVFTTTSATIPENLRIGGLGPEVPATWLASRRDQLHAVLHLGRYRNELAPVFVGLQVIFMATVARSLARRPHPWAWLLMAMTPVFYLAVHLVYQVHIEYPRHIVAGYLAMGCVVLLSAHAVARAESPSSR